ncbi:MAG: hypothetical protein LC101_06695, partial [Flavobacteriales bacterium]|nr:hypothetical protein [Flavobacteriales bacterium]
KEKKKKAFVFKKKEKKRWSRMEEYSSEEVYSLCSPTVRREYSSFGVEDWRSSLFSERSREREGLFVFFSNREDCFLEKANKSLLLHWNSSLLSERLFFSLSLSLEYIRSIYSFFLCSLYFFSR